jgi:hypothetical protein
MGNLATAVALQNVERRLRAEYRDMPGLRLTRPQIRRLCGIDPSACDRVLDGLISQHFLVPVDPERYCLAETNGAGAR